MPGTSGISPVPAPSGISPDEVTARVTDILEQVDEVRRTVGDQFDLAALTRQAELLEQAHQTLTAALEDVDPR